VGIYLAAGWRDAYRQAGSSRALLATVAALLELVETLAQLLINTVSFARLGAFALAHAGLGAAVITLAAIPDSTWAAALILVLGNALVIALEGLIVSIQTTRLVMFEFFRRFYTGSGREFRPLAVPDDTHPQAA
jgi:V/A-type H+-transporting ATPase subunit I